MVNQKEANMITLEHDKLKFSFPGLANELRQLTTAELEPVINRLMSEDRARAFARLIETNYRYSSLKEAQISEMQGKLLALTPDGLRAAILRNVGHHAFLNSNNKSGLETTISFQRTLRIPDDGKPYPLPPGLGSFPLRHVDDHTQKSTPAWLKSGGVMLPIYQAEALWLSFAGDYPCALKVGTGKINAVSGQSWTSLLSQNPQDYVILPEQPWLDGYCVEKGYIRQFVAMPLGEGYTAEEQVTGSGDHGGVQLQIYPLKAKIYFEESIRPEFPEKLIDILPSLIPLPERQFVAAAAVQSYDHLMEDEVACKVNMGLGAGGRMRQEIYADERPLNAWDTTAKSRCFVHLCNSILWQQITGQKPPHPPFNAAVYAKYGLPWFDYYREDIAALPGSSVLKKLKSVFQIARNKVEPSLLKQEPVEPTLIIQYGEKRRPDEVREWVD
jgi:hypothetical protein